MGKIEIIKGRLGTAAAGVLLILSAVPGHAEVAIAGKAGTLGAGAEVTVGLSRQLNARLGVNGYSYSDRREASGIEYDGEAKLRTGTALLDWHPGGGGFRLTGGAVYNDTTIEGTSIPPASGIYNIGGVPVPVSFVRTLNAKADFDPVVPYAGLGWGNAVAPDKKLGFFIDLGVIFQGKADVTLTPNIPADSPINTTPGAREALDILLRREEQDLEEDAADYDLYPVLSIGLSYKF
ncbi:MAG TPA: hypothetical protein VGX68_04735 [Thermoanaerobaculia bacterium]|jgi:hypothetical protein|nr:hypothetical protein [Thermoanaerobaculia bacterium]